MPISRRALIKTAALASAASLAPRVARAAYPERPVRLIVPFVPGGAVDAVGRLLGNAMTADLGQPVVIENRGGAGGPRGPRRLFHHGVAQRLCRHAGPLQEVAVRSGA
jgi:tripartite-type tricarboxylate transporter receptor subunit TctC